MKNGPILYVGGDGDDQLLIGEALEEIGCTSELISFNDSNGLIDHLREAEERPFFILCDIHLPGLSGLELKETINADLELKKRSIPFIFLSESLNPMEVDEAYLSLVQGFYLKSATFEGLKDQLSAICNYWERAVFPGHQF